MRQPHHSTRQTSGLPATLNHLRLLHPWKMAGFHKGLDPRARRQHHQIHQTRAYHSQGHHTAHPSVAHQAQAQNPACLVGHPASSAAAAGGRQVQIAVVVTASPSSPLSRACTKAGGRQSPSLGPLVRPGHPQASCTRRAQSHGTCPSACRTPAAPPQSRHMQRSVRGGDRMACQRGRSLQRSYGGTRQPGEHRRCLRPHRTAHRPRRLRRAA
uniref:Uncharacterized protein n=1 Tax=Arundo donax TaxID=35708 RepID=A0A0A9CWS5_ARUDO